MFSKNKLAALAAEFLGAGVLTLVVVSVQRSTIGVPYFIGIAGGLAIAMLVLVIGRASGAHLNPAITIGLWTARRVNSLTAVAYVVAQLLGGLAAGRLYQYYIGSDLTAVSDKFTGRLLVAEAIGTAIFALGWAAVTFNHYLDNKKAAVLGSAYALGVIAASSVSVGMLNPAIALGSNAWAWGTYVLGPVLGAVIGINLYGLLFAPDARAKKATAGAATVAPKAATTAKAKTTAKATTRKKTATKRK